MKRLVNVQNKLKAPKGNYNKFGKYNYRSAEDILTAVKPLLEEEGLCMVISDDVFIIENGWVYIKATVNIYDVEDITKPIATNTAFARESESKKGMDSSQITGTASSYARKYALNGIFLIDDTKDADTDEYHEQTKPSVPDMATINAQIKTLKLTDENIKSIKERYEVEDLKDLTDDQKIELGQYLGQKLLELKNEDAK